ncbi:MAG: 2,3-bisphosphoglycerate-independent phosphoglycerate mutase [Spirochaetota bacterium]|nr:2,3-bisphosphoglycerate-independent phosphoglycerate mutase [Spirochaetota bacterium]
MITLGKNSKFKKRKGPLVLVIMDGFGIGRESDENALYLARTLNLDRLMKNCLYTELKAHGVAVGLPSDKDMGNSEVGHNAIGAGRIFDQGAKLVSRAIESGRMFSSDTWKELLKGPVAEGKVLHFIGLLSDGNVHSHIEHLLKMIERASMDGVGKLRVHILLDGRDVPETSALIYVDKLEKHLSKFREAGLDYQIASGGGRMITTMDRYEADWGIVKRGWEAHVLGEARPFQSAEEAILTFREEDPSIIDQYLPSFTIANKNGPVGPIMDGDSVIFFNFRGDRAIGISRAFEEEKFNHFDRIRFPKVVFSGMMEYDGDLKIPRKYLVFPPAIDKTISEYLVNMGCRQYAVSETQKFGHVTYFWNGNRSGKFSEDLETYEEILSDKIEFDQRPWMKAAEITDKVIEAISCGEYDFIRLNFPNGDMVGHTGNLEAAIIAAEVVDLCIGRLLPVVSDKMGLTIITADHGNLDEMYELDSDGKIKMGKEGREYMKKTSHTLNPVPFIIFDPDYNKEYRIRRFDNSPGLANIASTLLLLMGYEPPEDYQPSIIEFN